jgi:hypothetical protein
MTIFQKAISPVMREFLLLPQKIRASHTLIFSPLLTLFLYMRLLLLVGNPLYLRKKYN